MILDEKVKTPFFQDKKHKQINQTKFWEKYITNMKKNWALLVLCLLVFGLNSVSAMSLSEALVYSVTGKTC